MKGGRVSSLLKTVVLLLVLIKPVGLAVATPGPYSAEQDARLGDHDLLPFSFVPNRGQFDDGVRFVARGARGTFFFTPQEVAVVFSRPNSDSPIEESHLDTDLAEQTGNKPTEHLALRIRLAGASPGTQIEGLEPLPGIANYYVGDDPTRWQQGVPTFASILYRDLYPHTDLRYYGYEGKLKYDFFLRPGADITRIGMVYDGAGNLKINGQGQLEIATPWGILVDEAPVAWQEGRGGQREPVDVRYCLRPGNHLGFLVGLYDPARPLVIDPSFSYSTFLGGGGSDIGRELALDAAGNVVAVGHTASVDFPTSVGAYDAGQNGSTDVFVLKMSQDGGTLLYSTFVGGSDSDVGYGLALDASRYALVTGYTKSTDFPTTFGVLDETHNGGEIDAYAFKLDLVSGSLVFSTYFGGKGGEIGRAADVDGAGNIAIVGRTDSPDFPVTNGAFDTGHNGSNDVFVLRLSYDGSRLLYSTFIGGSAYDYAEALELDEYGDAVVSGFTESPSFPTTAGVFQPDHNGKSDVFVLKLTANGSSLQYSTFVGGSGVEQGSSIALDDAGNAVVTGQTGSSGFPTTAGAFDRTHNGQEDVYVFKLSADGRSLLYSTLAGGGQKEHGYGLVLDSAGHAVITGRTDSSNFPTTSHAFDRTLNGGRDVFVLKLAGDGSALRYGSFVGGSSDEFGRSVVLHGQNAWLTGFTKSSDWPTSSNAYDRVHNGDSDAFLLRIDDLGGQEYVLSVSIDGNGTVDRNPDWPNYQAGDSITLTAQPVERFIRWTEDLSGEQNPATITMYADKSITAHFRQQCFSLALNVSPDDSGLASSSPEPNCPSDPDSYIEGTQVSVAATPASGYRFSYWTGDLSGTTSPVTITIDRNLSATAHFVEHGTGEPGLAYLPLILRSFPLVTVINGDFESGNTTGWRVSGDAVFPAPRVVAKEPYRGDYHLLLGAPDYCKTPKPDQPGDHSSIASQTIYVPDVPGTPVLTFWYRIFTYDHLTYTDGRLGDSLDVYVDDSLALRDNYENWPEPAPKCDNLKDSDWREPSDSWFSEGPPGHGQVNVGVLDLSEWEGQRVEIRIELWTRHDGWYNTWAYLDDVSVSVSSPFNAR